MVTSTLEMVLVGMDIRNAKVCPSRWITNRKPQFSGAVGSSYVYIEVRYAVNIPPPANRNRNRFTEPTSVQIGIEIVCEFHNFGIGIGKVLVRRELVFNYSQIPIIIFFLSFHQVGPFVKYS